MEGTLRWYLETTLSENRYDRKQLFISIIRQAISCGGDSGWWSISFTAMEDIRDIIGTIVRGCAQGGVIVPEVLAAFVARTVCEVYAVSQQRS